MTVCCEHCVQLLSEQQGEWVDFLGGECKKVTECKLPLLLGARTAVGTRVTPPSYELCWEQGEWVDFLGGECKKVTECRGSAKTAQ